MGILFTIKNHLLLPGLALTIVLCSSCDDNFSPKGDFQQHLVVYAVLSNRSDSQYVRVYTTYNLSGFDAAEHSTDTDVKGARVTMTDDSTTYTLKETIIRRDDKSRYPTDPVAYFAFPCTPRSGKQYLLVVQSNQGDGTATASVPTSGSIYFTTPYILKNPEKYKDDIIASLGFSPLARGFLVRLYIDLDVLVGQDLVHHRFEVPSSFSAGDQQNQFVYPTLISRPNQLSLTVSFSHDAYLAFFRGLTAQYGGFSLTSATFILTQIDPNLYKYYNIVNGFRDAYSVREDQPDYTNIVGGLGVFGAMVEDSVVVDLR